MDYNNLPPCVRDFMFYLEVVKGRSQLTVLNYYTDIKVFLRFMKIKNNPDLTDAEFSEIDISDVTDELIKSVTLTDVQEFLIFTTRTLKNDQKARARKAVVLRQFYKYLTNHKSFFPASPLANLELPAPKKALPKHLTLEQAIELLHSVEIDTKHSPFSERDYCILVFFLNCGMRLSELVGINRKDILRDENGKLYLRVLGKGAKERLVYLNSACETAYQSYLKALNTIYEGSEKPFVSYLKTDALFISQRYKRISNRRVQQIIEEILDKAGLGGMGLSVHKLRHTAATLMYQNGVDVRLLKDILGHENLNTTQIYTHVASRQMQEAMDKNPLNKKQKPYDNKD